jgi:hypothetical protein
LTLIAAVEIISSQRSGFFPCSDSENGEETV